MKNLPRQLSIDESIGQLLMVGFPGKTATPRVLELIQLGHVGGVILFSRNLGTPRQIRRLTSALQAAARAAGHLYPLLIATDQENGIVRRTGSATTYFPGNMALGAINSESAVEAVARATGEELRALGITMNLAPDVDISNNPANPVIGVRSFGADPDLVARLGAAAVRGYRAAGVAAALKHFPGHGDTDTDSHLALPVVPFAIERLEATELVPFRRAMAAGAEVIMTAHVAMPVITGSHTLPATLAPEVIEGLLRRQLGFGGVVITDCLEMRAISAGVGVAGGTVGALAAGADIVLISHRYDRQMAGLNAVRAAVERGDLTGDAIRAAARRVLHLKQSLPGWDSLPAQIGGGSVAPVEHQRLADDLYARSITVIRDEGHLLPLKLQAGVRLLVVAQATSQVSQAADHGFVPARFFDALQQRLSESAEYAEASLTAYVLPDLPTDTDMMKLQQMANEADIVLLATCNAHLPRYRAGAQAIVRTLLQAGRPLVGVAVGDPYDAAACPEIPTWLATYDYTSPALDAAARVLVGALPARGVLPVAL